MSIQEAIKRYIVDNILFGDDRRVMEDVSFTGSGILDSLGFLDLITFVEERFGIKVADEEVMPDNFDTLRRVSEFVTRKMDGKAITS